MWGPSRVFPFRPGPRSQEERRAGILLRRSYESRLSDCARRAEALADLWSEFPEVAVRHRQYARAFRSAHSLLWGLPAGSSIDSFIRLHLRRIAWKAYRAAMIPTDRLSDPNRVRAAQRQKIDAYWARQLWTMLGEGAVRRSALQARLYELQQICDAHPAPEFTPTLFSRIKPFGQAP